MGALTVPVYSGETGSADSTGVVSTTATGGTLVEVNGGWGLLLASIPLAVCALVAVLLLGPGGRPAQVAAAVAVALLAGLTVLSLLSIGIFIAPAVAALGVAVLGTLVARPPDAAGPTGTARPEAAR